MMLFLGWILAGGFAVWRAGRRLRFSLHMLQLEGYKTDEYLTWLHARLLDVGLRVSHGIGVVLVGVAWFEGGGTLVLVAWAIAFASSRRYRRDRPKKPLAATPRLKRLAVTSVVISLLLAVLTALSSMWFGAPGLAAGLSALLVVDVAAPWTTWMAGILMKPVERRNHNAFIRSAKARLAVRPDLSIVGITGSYGKTSVKFAVREILSQRFPVLATPGSYNTPMGICRVVNDQLGDDHRWLVLEMGIRHPGDIAELCDIARPDIAVITSVGMAHLETMGSIERIADEKGSLLSFVRPGGLAILNGDDERVRAMRAPDGIRTVLVSARGTATADLRATDIAYDTEGVHFTVGDNREEVAFTARLLGEHNILNILLAIAVGREAGLSLRQMRHAVARMQPVAHRLELRVESGVNILDDAFNSNPVGARSAVDVLSRFSGGQRIVITPGMVELGDLEAEENRAWGRFMASRVDRVVLVGPERTRPIAEGLLEEGLDRDRIEVVRTLYDARDWLRSHSGPGDTVLYENDLPDQYTEAT